MKTLFLTLIFFLFNQSTTEITGLYQIENERYMDTLELKKDGTYAYQSRGSSCWTWSDFSGTWKLNGDELTLYHNYSVQEETTEFIEEVDEFSTDKVTCRVMNFNGVPISEFELNYVSKENKIQTKKTDENGVIIFDKYDVVYDQNDRVGIQFKFKTNGNDTSVSSSVSRNSDQIILKINSTPKTIAKKEKYSFSYKNGILKSIEFRYVNKASTYKKL